MKYNFKQKRWKKEKPALLFKQSVYNAGFLNLEKGEQNGRCCVVGVETNFQLQRQIKR